MQILYSALFVLILALSSCSAINTNFNVTLSCSSSKYTANRTYERNVNALLRSLRSKVSSNGFSTATAGRNVNKVYGLALCQGDLRPAACANAITSMAQPSFRMATCPMAKAAALWYRGCLLRYSNLNFFGVMGVDDMKAVYHRKNSSGVLIYDRRWRSFVANLSANATSHPRTMFATGDLIYSGEEKIFTLVQCTGDVSVQSCSYCLNQSVSYAGDYWMSDTQWGWIISTSCFLGFEIHPYIWDDVCTPSSPSPLPPLPQPRSLPSAAESCGAGSRCRRVRTTDAVIICFFISMALLIVSMLVVFWRKAMGRGEDGDITEMKELQMFDWEQVLAATHCFSEENRLGQGGYGSVHKGRLPDGQEIAVKRLSRSSAQGSTQFMNEVQLVAKLQHKNLVRLLGCCRGGEEKVLVYEYVPNKSLDKVIFDPVGKLQLDWVKRVKVIVGIAKGLLYLHEGSRLKIIHRDLKASNILLDQDMTPKISDFGLAKFLWTDLSESSASRVAGTFGYMAPEYVIQGRYSSKSDVFSFGILMLEIVTGRENINSDESQGSPNLLTHVWNAWREGRAAELVDETLNASCDMDEALRFIHISFLCVQKIPARRPTVASVLHMLGSRCQSLPTPSTPAFFLGTERDQPEDVTSGESGTAGGSEITDFCIGSISISEDSVIDNST